MINETAAEHNESLMDDLHKELGLIKYELTSPKLTVERRNRLVKRYNVISREVKRREGSS